jgi:hypothetical protein
MRERVVSRVCVACDIDRARAETARVSDFTVIVTSNHGNMHVTDPVSCLVMLLTQFSSR